MSTRSDRHAACLERLPAFVRGSLPPAETAAVIAHAIACTACRAELVFARRLRSHFAQEHAQIAPLLDATREQADFDRLWARITKDEPTLAIRELRGRMRPAMFALAATVMFGVGYVWLHGAVAPDYRTLAQTPAHACGQLRVQFAPQTQPADRARLVDSAGARIVDGPSAAGVYTLGTSDAEQSLRDLRAHPEVQLAELTNC